MAAAALTFQFSSKLSPSHAVRSPKPCNSSLPFSSSSHNHVSLSTSSTRTPKLKVTIFASPTSSLSILQTQCQCLQDSLLGSVRRDSDMLSRAFGQLVEVNLVMDEIANRPRGFAFLRGDAWEVSGWQSVICRGGKA